MAKTKKANGKRKNPPVVIGNAAGAAEASQKKKPGGRKRKKSGDGKEGKGDASKAIHKPALSKCPETYYYDDTNDNPSNSCNVILQKSLPQPRAGAKIPFHYAYSMGKCDRLPSPKNATNKNNSNDVFANETNVLVSALEKYELEMWASSLGASNAAKGFAPSNIGRKMGTITRKLWLPSSYNNSIRSKKERSSTKQYFSSLSKPTYPTLARAKKEIIAAATASSNNKPLIDYDVNDDPLLITRATELVDSWKKSFKAVGQIHPNWNIHGELPILPVVGNRINNDGNGSNDQQQTYTQSIENIYNMLTKGKWIDDSNFVGAHKKLYHLEIPTDTLTVLKALRDLSRPDPKLYNLPLVVSIPVLEPMPSTLENNDGPMPWRLTISIFCHRLLFECMTANALRTVMEALDDPDRGMNGGPRLLARPLVPSPAMGPIVFGKDPNTKVEILQQNTNDNDSDNDEISVIEIDLDDEDDGEGGRTRNDDTLDAFSTEGFLKLIENQGVSGVDTIYETTIRPMLHGESNENPRLQVSLLPHQIHGVCWMYQMETLDANIDDKKGSNDTNNPSLGLNGLLWERRRFHEGDTYYYSPALGQARLRLGDSASGRKRVRRGGILADEMGLGKTVQAVALVLATLNDLQNEAETRNLMEQTSNDYNKKFHSHATLIIVPSALISQWMNEIRKIAGHNLVMQFLDHKEQNHRVELDPSADIVLTTYQVMEKTKGKKTPFRSNKQTQSRRVNEILTSTSWGRIILDEMQEVRSWNTSISKTCTDLESDRRWMLSGTPLWEGINDFKGELCFLGLEPFAANNEDGFFDFAIANHWKSRSPYGLEILRILSLVMLRRTKSMSIIESGLPLLGLKNLTLVFEPVPQDPSERAMYCFLESVMHSTLMESKDTENKKQTKQNRLIFLRLLRELCVSPYLINGGIGCSSQLKVLNRLMKEYNRKQLSDRPSSHQGKDQSGNDQFYSCDEAIQFLSQVEDFARTDSDFVTDTRLGGGGGVSRRNRALLINPQEKVDSAREQIAKSIEICREATSARAKARWHLALERVTTGGFIPKGRITVPGGITLDNYDNIQNRALLKIWKLRRITPTKYRLRPKAPPPLLNRGFRLTDKYFGINRNDSFGSARGINKQQQDREEKLICLGKRHPSFNWTHPYAFELSNIPIQASCEQLQQSINGSLGEGKDIKSIKVLHLGESKDSKSWKAIVQLSTGEDFDRFERCVKKVDGIAVKTREKVQWIRKELNAAAVKYHDAEAMLKVHPCELNERNVIKTKAEYNKCKLGLRILDKARHRSGHILYRRAFGKFRGAGPKSFDALVSSAEKQIEEATDLIAEHKSIIYREEKTIKSMQHKIDMNVAGSGVENLNTIDVLQALKNGEANKTNCPICYDDLGAGENSNGKVLMTRCGHLSCKCCLRHWIHQKEASGSGVSCIECRKPIRPDELICIDPKKVDTKEQLDYRKKKANDLVQQAAKMLEENYGQLEPHLWEALYMVIDLPSGIDKNRHTYFTAIPGLFLGHLRHAMGNCLPIDSRPEQRSVKQEDEICLPSKIRALLADLPREELSVVFASSKPIVLHLQNVLEREGFGCKTLFVGQSEKQSGSAVSDWESSSDAATVLIVQAGAAACGLTLTAACKMFIIEPFRKHEEEKQAYARLHRFGQKKAVSCKVYYTPVSVESRLLEWRRRAKTHASKEEKTVYAPLRHSQDNNNKETENDGLTTSTDKDEQEENYDGNDENETAVEENQTQFLLGLARSNEQDAPTSRIDGGNGTTAEDPIELD